MKTTPSLVLFAGLAIALSGCSTINDFNSPNHPKKVLYYNWNDSQAEQFQTGEYRNL